MSIFSNYAYVFFVCEGKNEEAALLWIHENHKMGFAEENYSLDFMRTRGRKSWDKLRDQCFQFSYDGDVAVFYLLDSKREERENLRSKYTGREIPVIKILTPPAIEILLILANPATEHEWEKASRKNRQLKPSEFCKTYFNCNIKNGDNFIDKFGSFENFEQACRVYKSRHSGQFCIYDLLEREHE